MLMARIFSYHDTHLHRIGPNYEQLPINRPQCPVHSYNKDGQMAYHHAGDQPVYAPNSQGGPAADPAKGVEIGWDVDAAELARTVYERGPRGRRPGPRQRLLPATEQMRAAQDLVDARAGTA
jgi:catalase